MEHCIVYIYPYHVYIIYVFVFVVAIIGAKILTGQFGGGEEE